MNRNGMFLGLGFRSEAILDDSVQEHDDVYIFDRNEWVIKGGLIPDRDLGFKNWLFDTFNFRIKKVIFNDPATIILWKDGTKTVVKCQEGDTYSKELGLAMCISKKALGNKGNFNDIFKEWAYEGE